jgi:hypothetical protein
VANTILGWFGFRHGAYFDPDGRRVSQTPADNLGGKLRTPEEILAGETRPAEIINRYIENDGFGKVVSNNNLWGGFGTPGSDYGLSRGEIFSDPLKGDGHIFPDPFKHDR